MSWKSVLRWPYSIGFQKPTCVPVFWLTSATRPAHRGATALVPPIASIEPSTSTLYPVIGSAFPATSGTPRFWLVGFAPFWYVGREKEALNPPPVAPCPVERSFQTTSLLMLPFAATSSRVPPHASENGHDAGKST